MQLIEVRRPVSGSVARELALAAILLLGFLLLALAVISSPRSSAVTPGGVTWAAPASSTESGGQASTDGAPPLHGFVP